MGHRRELFSPFQCRWPYQPRTGQGRAHAAVAQCRSPEHVEEIEKVLTNKETGQDAWSLPLTLSVDKVYAPTLEYMGKCRCSTVQASARAVTIFQL